MAKTTKQWREEQPILTASDRRFLERERRNAKHQTTTVHEHERSYYRLRNSQAALTARWEDLEYAAYRLCSAIDRVGGAGAKDAQRGQRIISLIEDTITGVLT